MPTRVGIVQACPTQRSEEVFDSLEKGALESWKSCVYSFLRGSNVMTELRSARINICHCGMLPLKTAGLGQYRTRPNKLKLGRSMFPNPVGGNSEQNDYEYKDRCTRDQRVAQ